MAYSELIKNFNNIRDYMREFYVYGFKSRDEYTKKSARSYDDERRRLESWLGDYMRFRRAPDGKNVFLSIDSRVTRRNPLYKAWKAKSFTDGDVTLHFILFDILDTPEKELTLKELTDRIDDALSAFDGPRTYDASTVRKKLNEYIAEGIVGSRKDGRTVYYRRAGDPDGIETDALSFFSEVAPCGVVGSFLLDKEKEKESNFAFKHHYITGAADSEIVCSLFCAMNEKRAVDIEYISRRNGGKTELGLVPLRIMISAQNGRQHLMAYSPRFRRITSYRADSIVSVTPTDVCPDFDALREKLDGMEKNLWGVSTQGFSGKRLEHVEFTVRFDPEEKHIPQRLEREKRCGRVERVGENAARFSADVYDASELIPWIRTFICRITSLEISDKELEARFKSDLDATYALYGLEGDVDE